MRTDPSKPAKRWAANEWRIRPRVDDIDSVLDNALDLLEDSKRCKGPGALALAELSLEQASLAALLWGRWLLDQHGVTESLVRGEAFLPLSATTVPIAVTMLVEDLGEFTDAQIQHVSRNHPPSLQHVESVLRFMERMAPYILAPQRVASDLRAILPWRARLRLRVWGKERFVRVGKQELASLMAKARQLAIPYLDKRKNSILYARVEPATGHVTLADLADDLLAAVIELSGLLQEIVTSALNSSDVADERGRKRDERIKFLRRIEKATGARILPPDDSG